MSRVILICAGRPQADERVERLTRARYEVDVPAGKGAAGLRAFRENPPDVFVIDLSRTPSYGGAAATMLRQQKATRRIPIVFVGGDHKKVARIREQMPDAVYTQWSRINAALRRAIEHPPHDPLVPGTMDAYSTTPLPKKLGIRAGTVLALLGSPRGFELQLGVVAKEIRIKKQARGHADLIMLFVKSRAELDRRLCAAQRAMATGGSIWIVWPKKASGVTSDLTQIVVRKVGLDAGLVDYKIAAIDATWSGLRFARRRARSKSTRS
jgi:CheY-like chemotaxis protein